MAGDYLINIYLDDEKIKKLEEAGLSDNIKEIKGKKAIQVEVTAKDQKKLTKAFPNLEFDESNACVLPKEPEDMLFNMIVQMKTLDVMKVYILKAYSPTAGKEPRHKVF
jgi:hypothetical protein